MVESIQIVARQSELRRLEGYLEAALNGRGQVCFLTGEAGSGKSTLAFEFIRQAQLKHPDLLVSAGSCDPQIGEAVPYAPFRDILSALSGATGDSRDREPKTKQAAGTISMVAETILELGPDLIDIFVPGGFLVSIGLKLGGFAVGKMGWLDKLKDSLERREEGQKLLDSSDLTQDQILEQYVNVMRGLTKKQAMVMVLDDLHWADAASIDLLFRLLRRSQDCRLFLIGTYRPNELTIAASGAAHPLGEALDELKRYFGDAWLDLDQVKTRRGREFVDAIVDLEANRLDESFRAMLHRQTGGHPLFTVELLRDLQERGRLAKDGDGYWVVDHDIAWEKLPLRVEGVIANRIRRLEYDVREYLNIGSVEGEQFTVEVIAEIQSQETRALVRRFSGDLQKAHQLVEAMDVQRIERQRISRYRFAHNLLQHYLYHELDPVEASFLHEEVGLALEALYGDAAGEIAPQLARHFERAEMPDRACRYLRLAAEQAAAGFANENALEYYNRALELHEPDNILERYDLLLGRERVCGLLGKRAQQRADLEELDRLLLSMPADHTRHAEVSLRRGKLAMDLSQFKAAVEAARETIEWAEGGDKNEETTYLQVDGHLLWGRSDALTGQYKQARAQLLQGLELARQAQYLPGEMRALELLGTLEWRQGSYAAAKTNLQKAQELAHTSGNIRREYSVLNNLGVLHTARKDYATAGTQYQEALKIVRRIGDRRGEVFVLSNLGEVNLYIGDYVAVQQYAGEALAIAEEIDDPMPQGIILVNLSEAYRDTGDYTQAKEHGERSLEILGAIQYRMGEAIALENLARIALALGKLEKAEEQARLALQISEEIEARSNQGAVLGLLGDILYELDRFQEAEAAHIQAKAILGEIDEPFGCLQAQAGLARIAATGKTPDREQALKQITPILESVLEDVDSDLAEKMPLSAYLACIEVLDAIQDSRAAAFSAAAGKQLHKRSQRISDPVVRFSFLENVPVNLEIRRRSGSILKK